MKEDEKKGLTTLEKTFLITFSALILFTLHPMIVRGFYLASIDTTNGVVINSSVTNTGKIEDKKVHRGKVDTYIKYIVHEGEITYRYTCHGREINKTETVKLDKNEVLTFKERYQKDAIIPLKVNPEDCSVLEPGPSLLEMITALIGMMGITLLACFESKLKTLEKKKKYTKKRFKLIRKIGKFIFKILFFPFIVIGETVVLICEPGPVHYLVGGVLPMVLSYFLFGDFVSKEFEQRNWNIITGQVISSSLEKTEKTTFVKEKLGSQREEYLYKSAVNYSYSCQGQTYSKDINENITESSLADFRKKYSEGASLQLKINPADCSKVVLNNEFSFIYAVALLVSLAIIVIPCFVYFCLIKLPRAIFEQKYFYKPVFVEEIFKDAQIENISPELINNNSDYFFVKGTGKKKRSNKKRSISYKEVLKKAKTNIDIEDEFEKELNKERENDGYVTSNGFIELTPEEKLFWTEIPNQEFYPGYELKEKDGCLSVNVKNEESAIDNLKKAFFALILLAIVVALVLGMSLYYFIFTIAGAFVLSFMVYLVTMIFCFLSKVFGERSLKQFDKQSGYFFEGKDRPNLDKAIRLSSIKALQVLELKKQSGYQLNLVLNDDSRVHLLSSTKLIEVLKVADKVVGFLRLPVMIDRGISKYNFQ